MQQIRPFWFLTNIYAWVVLLMSIVTAIIVGAAVGTLLAAVCIVLLGVIGYLLALLLDLIGGSALGRTGAVRLARAEQENRELRAEQARLLGAIRERDEKLAALQKNQPAKDIPQEDRLPPPSSAS